MQPLQVTLFIVGTIVIIIAAYYVTYFIGIKSSGASRGRNRNINLLDRFSISKDKSFCLVEIAGKVYVVAVTNQSMTLLDTLDAATFAENAAERGGASSWQAPGGKYSARMTGKLASFLAARMGRPDPNSKPDPNSRPDLNDRPDQNGKPDQAGRPDQNDKPEQAGRPDQNDKPDQVGRPDPNSRPDQNDRHSRNNEPGLPEKEDSKPGGSFQDSMRAAQDRGQDSDSDHKV